MSQTPLGKRSRNDQSPGILGSAKKWVMGLLTPSSATNNPYFGSPKAQKVEYDSDEIDDDQIEYTKPKKSKKEGKQKKKKKEKSKEKPQYETNHSQAPPTPKELLKERIRQGISPEERQELIQQLQTLDGQPMKQLPIFPQSAGPANYAPVFLYPSPFPGRIKRKPRRATLRNSSRDRRTPRRSVAQPKQIYEEDNYSHYGAKEQRIDHDRDIDSGPPRKKKRNAETNIYSSKAVAEFLDSLEFTETLSDKITPNEINEVTNLLKQVTGKLNTFNKRVVGSRVPGNSPAAKRRKRNQPDASITEIEDNSPPPATPPRADLFNFNPEPAPSPVTAEKSPSEFTAFQKQEKTKPAPPPAKVTITPSIEKPDSSVSFGDSEKSKSKDNTAPKLTLGGEENTISQTKKADISSKNSFNSEPTVVFSDNTPEKDTTKSTEKDTTKKDSAEQTTTNFSFSTDSSTIGADFSFGSVPTPDKNSYEQNPPKASFFDTTSKSSKEQTPVTTNFTFGSADSDKKKTSEPSATDNSDKKETSVPSNLGFTFGSTDKQQSPVNDSDKKKGSTGTFGASGFSFAAAPSTFSFSAATSTEAKEDKTKDNSPCKSSPEKSSGASVPEFSFGDNPGFSFPKADTKTGFQGFNKPAEKLDQLKSGFSTSFPTDITSTKASDFGAPTSTQNNSDNFFAPAGDAPKVGGFSFGAPKAEGFSFSSTPTASGSGSGSTPFSFGGSSATPTQFGSGTPGGMQFGAPSTGFGTAPTPSGGMQFGGAPGFNVGTSNDFAFGSNSGGSTVSTPKAGRGRKKRDIE